MNKFTERLISLLLAMAMLAPTAVLGDAAGERIGSNFNDYSHASATLLGSGDNRVADSINDGIINNVDLAIVQRYIAEWDGYTELDLSSYDCNSDGIINANDSAVIARYIAGWDGYEDYFDEPEREFPDLNGTGSFVGGSYTYEDNTIATSLYVPEDYTPDKEYSLLIYFHNVGGRGGTPYWTGGKGNQLVKNVIELTDDSTVVFAPRCPTTAYWVEQPYAPGYYSFEDTPISNPMTATVSYIYDVIFENYNIDKTRVWAFGDSLGGGATWDLMLREPTLLAGAVPVAGYCDPTQAMNVDEQTAVYAIHTKQDKSVNVRGDRAMTAALESLGRNVQYLEYDSENPEHKEQFNESWVSSSNWEHWAWVPAYNDRSVAEWLVAQKRSGTNETVEQRFTDVSPEDSFFKAVDFVVETGMMRGSDTTLFDPDGSTTRAAFVTALGVMCDVDTSKYTNVTFADVEPGAWYAPYVEWGNAVGVLKSMTEAEFGVNGTVTIQQACLILARFANYAETEIVTQLSLDEYSDCDDVSDWAAEGVDWAITNGVYLGTLGNNSKLNPTDVASRALVAEMLYMYDAIYNR